MVGSLFRGGPIDLISLGRIEWKADEAKDPYDLGSKSPAARFEAWTRFVEVNGFGLVMEGATAYNNWRWMDYS